MHHDELRDAVCARLVARVRAQNDAEAPEPLSCTDFLFLRPLAQAQLQASEKKQAKNLAGLFEAPKPGTSSAARPAESSTGGGFSFPSFSLPSFGTEPVSSGKPAAPAGPAEPKEGPSPLLLAALVLFSPLLVVQLVQVQTIVRLGSQALGIASSAEETGTVKVRKPAPRR
jgi:hypothetical protein